MELILKKDKGWLIRHFKQEWQTKWVPVIITFAESYTRKSKAAIDVQDYGKKILTSTVRIGVDLFITWYLCRHRQRRR